MADTLLGVAGDLARSLDFSTGEPLPTSIKKVMTEAEPQGLGT